MASVISPPLPPPPPSSLGGGALRFSWACALAVYKPPPPSTTKNYQLSTANLMAEKAVELDRDTFGVAVGQGDNPRNRGDPGSEMRLDPLGAFGGAASRTFRGL
jgi:hypothetical protein